MNISETSKISLDIKALIGMIIGIVTVASIWFNLTAEIEMLKIKVSKIMLVIKPFMIAKIIIYKIGNGIFVN